MMGSTDPESRNGADRASHVSGQQRPRIAGVVQRFRARFNRADAPPAAKPPPPPPLSPPPPPKQAITGEELARDIRQKGNVDTPQGIRYQDLKVTGDVGLSHCRIQNAVRFVNCEFERFCAPEAVMFALSFTGCSMTAFGAESTRFESDLIFTDCRIGAEGIVAENARLDSDCRIVQSTCLGPINFADSIVQGDVILTDVTLQNQTLTLDDASVSGSVRIKACDFKGSKLELGSMKVAFRIELLNLKHHPHRLFLTGTTTTTYKEDRSAWPDPGGLHLDRFTYERLSVEDFSVSRHVRWLNLQYPRHLRGRGFRSQPWRHLASVINRRGSFDDARHLSIHYRDAMLNARIFNPPTWAAHWLFGFACRYGLQPWRPVGWLVFMVLLGTVVFEAADHADLVHPSQAVHVIAVKTNDVPTVPGEYPLFNSLLYSLENTLPAVNLKQGEHYDIHIGEVATNDQNKISMTGLRSTWIRSAAAPVAKPLGAVGQESMSAILGFFIPLQAIVGAILVSLTVLSFTGVFEQRLLD